MGKARRVTLERVNNGFLVRWTPTAFPQDTDLEERVHICADLEVALQMLCDEISLEGEEMDVSLTERTQSHGVYVLGVEEGA